MNPSRRTDEVQVLHPGLCDPLRTRQWTLLLQHSLARDRVMCVRCAALPMGFVDVRQPCVGQRGERIKEQKDVKGVKGSKR